MAQRILVVGAVVLAVLNPRFVAGQSKGPTQSGEVIIKREEARLAALRSAKGREDFYDRDYVNISPPGVVTVGYQPSEPNSALNFNDIKVVVTTQSGAVVTLLQSPRPKTTQMPSPTGVDRSLGVWANEQGTWRLVARQAVWVRPAETAAASRVKAPSVSPYQPKNAAAGEILKANEWIEDAFRRHDGAAYERLTLPEFVRIGTFGQLTPRAQWIKAAVQENKDTDLTPRIIDDVRIRVYGDVAVMTWKTFPADSEGMTQGQGQRMMRAWVKQNDGWKLAATISTIVWQGEKAQ